MTTRALALVVASSLWSVSVMAGASSGRQADSDRRVSSLDDVLTRYAGGEFDIVQRSFREPRDFHQRLRPTEHDIHRWLGSWDRAKAVLILELARASTRVAPQYVKPLLRAGRQYVGTQGAGRVDAADAARFNATWNRAALAILEGFGQPAFIEEFTDALPSGPDPVSPGAGGNTRVALARAVAQEQRCWSLRPWIEQPGAPTAELGHAAGRPVRGDRDGPTRAASDARNDRHRSCLDDAVARFETAVVEEPQSAAEARVRGGWMLFQAGRLQDALARLDQADPGADADLAYWRHLFRGRVLDALVRFRDAGEEYRAALTLFPQAQTAAVGYALALLRQDRDSEADAVARAQRVAAITRDPWTGYMAADYRWLGGWLDELRGALR